ncbi:MAG: TetR/AcrR family transcriptional regulator of autoinduction and epiphytic fitness [Cognaticolwellia sp.]|jgi:TetR/AcrR family transcriptional regulator of autoinduction and epiphytic fitness
MTRTPTPPMHTETLEAAFPLFLRFGYRKTSMDELARAAGISRQGLYLRFPNKKALFIAMVDHLCEKVEQQIEPAFGASPPDLVAAFDAYVGAFVASGASYATADEMVEAAASFRGGRLQALDSNFQSQLVDALQPYANPGLSAQDLAAILSAASHGFKHSSESRQAYRESMALAVALAHRTAEKG